MRESSDASTRTKRPARWGRLVGDRSGYPLTPEIRDRIAGYRPLGEVRPEILEWTQATVLSFRPTKSGTTHACSRLYAYGRWLWSNGYDLRAPHADLLAAPLVDAYIAAETTLSETSLASIRSLLNQVRRAVTGERKIVSAGYRTDVDGAVAPYAPREVARLVQFVDGLSSNPRHHFAARAFLGLSLGAGARLGDMIQIAVEDWTPVGNGLLVSVGRGADARTIEVTNGWSTWLLDLRDDLVRGDPFQVGSPGRGAASAAKALENLDGRRGDGLSDRERERLGLRLNFERGRTTWMVERLGSRQRLDLLLEDAGLTSAATLDRYLQFLPESRAPRRRST
jgi:hypothetical protein